MKTIHLLSTDKPSKILFDMEENYYLPIQEEDVRMDYQDLVQNRHIYITSDEEIKEGDYVIEDIGGVVYGPIDRESIVENPKKIILTTDQDLIAEGVQAIDNEFLEWFVKNPSCEFVKITKDKIRQDKEFNDISHWNIYEYKISIPQEEPKRKIDTCYNFDMEIGCVQDICRCEQEEPKQETLTYTEAAKKEERIFNSTMMSKQETLEEDNQDTAIRFLEWYRRKNIFFQFHHYHIPNPGDKNWEQTVFRGDNSYLTSRQLFAIFKKEIYE